MTETMQTSGSNGRPTLTSTVKDAKDWLRDRLHDGVTCPVCQQQAKIYKRKITASMVTTMGKVVEAQRGPKAVDGYVYLPSIMQRSRDFATLRYFGLVQQKPEKRDDGGSAGWWRVTDDGLLFLRGGLTVFKYAVVYNGNKIGTDGERVGVGEIAPEFRLDELKLGI